MFRRRPIGKSVLNFLIPCALAGAFASLGAGLAACAPSPLPVGEGLGVGSPSPTQTVTPTFTPTFTPTLDFLHLDRIPGLDPLTFAGRGEAATRERYSLPQDVFAEARSRQLAPIEAEGGIAAACTNDSCTVMLTKYLVNGAELKEATDGKVIYGLDGQAGSEALFRFSGLPEGVKATAFVAQDGNPWGFRAGTVVVWFWEGGGKGGAQILNLDNPLRIMADKPNSIQISALDNGLVVTTTDAGGTVIDEQRVVFLPPLPSEVLSQIPTDKQYEIVNGQVLVDGQAWFEINSAGEWQETNAKLLADAVAEGYKLLDLEKFPTLRDFLRYSETVCANSRSLGDVGEARLLERMAGLTPGTLWKPEFYENDFFSITVGPGWKCAVLLVSTEPRDIGDGARLDNDWGKWRGTVKVVFITSMEGEGEAERYIFFPK